MLYSKLSSSFLDCLMKPQQMKQSNKYKLIMISSVYTDILISQIMNVQRKQKYYTKYR